MIQVTGVNRLENQVLREIWGVFYFPAQNLEMVSAKFCKQTKPGFN
jgi:hypothetical protein